MTLMRHGLFGAITFAALGLAGCGDDTPSPPESDAELQATESEPDTWRFALEEIEGSVQHAYASEFKERIEARTEDITVEIYPFGTLGTSSQLTELMRQDALELAFASPGHLADRIPEVGVFTLHFIMPDDDQLTRDILSDPSLYELFQKPFQEENLQLLDIIPEGWMVWSGDRPLRTPEDFEGFRMRTMTSPILVESYKAYGANPTPMPYSEVFSGLQLELIDGQVNPIFAIQEMGFHEEQDYLTSARHAQFISTLAASRQWYQGLDESHRELITEVRSELVDWIDEEQIRYNEERLEQILDEGGTEWIELSDEEREVFREASRYVRQIYLEQAGERGQEILDTILERVESSDRVER